MAENYCNLDDADQQCQLSDSQKARIERNRQKALLLRQSRIAKRQIEKDVSGKTTVPTKVKKVVDTGAGFLLEDEEEEKQNVAKIIHKPGAILSNDHLFCEECDREFLESHLLNQFSFPVCDECRDSDEKHTLITKSDAKSKYLLKDADFDKREPPLKFIVKKNPHNSGWGDMKLFLEIQVAGRALEVWGSEEAIEEERERRSENKEKMKQKKFDKKVKELRKAVRSSLYKKDTGSHEHEFGAETYNEEDDLYTKTCKTCGHTMSYEKM